MLDCVREVECPAPHDSADFGRIFFMNILEVELEDLVFNTSNHKLHQRGLMLNGEKLRQVNLGSYGIADIICLNPTWGKNGLGKTIEIQVVELKKEVINQQTLMQASRYCTAIKRALTENLKINDYYIEISIVLIGKYIDTYSDFVYLLDFMPSLQVYTCSIDLDKGVRFERKKGYSMTNEVLPNLKPYLKTYKSIYYSFLENRSND